MGLLILVFTSNRFVGFLADAAEGALPGDLVFQMLAFKMLATMPKIFPVAILIAMLMSFARMANDKELVVMLAAGISRRFQLETVLRFALFFSTLVTVFILFIAPWAEQQMQQLKEVAKQRADIAGIRPGQFKEFNKGERIVYVQKPSEDKLSMEDVFLYVRDDDRKAQGKKHGVLTAETARFKNDKDSGNRYIEFQQGQRYVIEPKTLDYQITEFDTYALITEQADVESSSLKTEALPTSMLITSDNKAHQAEFQWRISLIIACILLPIFSVMLIQIHTREEKRYGPFILAISVYFIYSNMIRISHTLVRKESIPAFVGVWWVHILLIGVIAALFYFSTNRPQQNETDQLLNTGETE